MRFFSRLTFKFDQLDLCLPLCLDHRVGLETLWLVLFLHESRNGGRHFVLANGIGAFSLNTRLISATSMLGLGVRVLISISTGISG